MDAIAQRVLQKRKGSSLNGDAIAQRVLQKMATKNRPPVQESEKYKRAVAEAERYKQEAEKAKSPLGFAWNAVKALPRAIGDTLVGTPAKFIASTAEVPGVLLRGGKTTQREYKIPGLSPFKSYQSDFEKTAGDVIEGRAGLGKAAWEMAKVPLAGLEMYGLGKGAQNVVKSGSILARTPSKQAAKELAYDIADTFLPTTRGIKTSGATERKLRETLSDLQMQRMRASLAVDRPRPDQYASGVRGKLVSKAEALHRPEMSIEAVDDTLLNEAKKYKSADEFVSSKFSPMGRIKTKEIDNVFRSIPDGTVSPENGHLGGFFKKSGEKIYPSEKAIPQVLKDNGIELDADGSVKEGMMVNKINFTEDTISKSQLTDIWNKANGGKFRMTSQDTEQSLLEEARKYKSAEEFVKAQGTPVYHGTKKKFDKFQEPQGGYLSDATFFAPSEYKATYYSEGITDGAGYMHEVYISPKAKLWDFRNKRDVDALKKFVYEDKAFGKYLDDNWKYTKDDIVRLLKQGDYSWVQRPEIIKEMKRLGYDGFINVDHYPTGADISTGIFETKNFKTKSQLTDIWKKANQASPVDANNIVTNFSGETITPKINYRKFIEENLGIKDRRPDTRGFDSKIAMLEKELKRPDLFVSDLANRGARTFSAPRRMITSGSRILRESGLGGRALEQLIRKQQLDSDLMIGGYNKRISEAISGLSKAERTNVTDVLEGTAKPLSQKAQEAATKMRSLYDEIAGEATKREFTIRTPEGVDVPFRPRENYAPRMYNWDDFTKGRRREEALQHLVDTGQARNKAEAAKALDTYIKENAQRRAGNIENARMFDLPGYEKDAEIAARAYAQRAAERFTQADIFGKNDEVPAALINKIANEGGDYEEAQRVFDFLFQGLPKSKVASAITQFNLATKLDLGAITNITQSVNTATKAGILNTAKAIFKGFTKEGKDLAELANVYDEMVIVQETGMKMNRFVRAVMKPFQIVERFNRRTAGMAGKLRAEQLAKILQKNPESSIAIRQMKTLGIDPAKIINGKLSGEDVLIAANRMSELTQFKPNVLNTPVAWRTPLGRVLMQFKSFAYMQTRFITDEIAKEAKQGNVAPLLRFILLAGIISPLTYETRNLVAGRDESDTKKSLDTRKFDKYFGAGKSFYTEPFTQGAFLGETYMNPNATSMKKLARTIGTFGGPTAGEVGNTLTSLESADRTNTVNKNWYAQHELAQDDPWLMAKRQAAGTIPFVGEYLKNTAFGFKDTPAEQAESIIKDGIKNGDFNKIAEGLSIDPYYKKPGAFRNLIKEVSQETSENEKDQELFYELQKRKLKPFFTP